MKIFTLSTLTGLLLFCFSGLFAQNTTILTPVKDNTIFSESGTKSLGAGKIFTGQNCQGNIRRALIEFDLTGIPGDATVTEVVLRLGAEKNGDDSEGNIEIYGLTREWGEGFSSGSGNGGPASGPDATWTDAILGTEFWDTPGGDFASAVLSTRFTDESFTTIDFPSSANFVSQAQAWVDDSESNHGIIIRGIEGQNCSAYRFGARDIGTAPELVVTWEAASGCQTTVTDLSIQACDSYSSPAGNTYTETGMYNETVMGADNCDSIFNIDLTVFTTSELLINNTLCEGSSYTLEGVVFDQNNPSGTIVYEAVSGCDSLVNVDLSFVPNSASSINNMICGDDGFSIIVNGNTYDAANPSGTEIVESFNGCDSTVTINLEFLPASNGREEYTGCEGDGYSVVVNGNIYNDGQPTGTEVLAGMGANGCDSTVVIDLVFNPAAFGEETYSGCTGDGYMVVVNGTTFDEDNPSGTVGLIAASGCDSTVNVELSFNELVTIDQTISACEEYTSINGFTYDASGIYTETVAGAAGDCDSLFNLDLTINNAANFDLNSSLCDGENLMVGGDVYDENNLSGTTVLQASNGCDSIVNVSLTFLETASSEQTLETCDPSTPATSTETIANGAANGCDSVITFTTVYLMSDSTEIFTTSCNPADTGTVVETFTNPSGCDSVVTNFISLEMLNNSVVVSDAMITALLANAEYQWVDCDNNNAPVDGATGQNFFAEVSGNYAVMITQNGCTVMSECNEIVVLNNEEVWFQNQLTVAPNPTRGDIRLTFGALENVNVRILDLTGRVILEKTRVTGGSEDLQITGAAGIYFVEVAVDGVRGYLRVVKN